METLAYLYVAVAYEETTDPLTFPVLEKLEIFKDLDRQKLSSTATSYLLSLALNLVFLSLLHSANAIQTEDRGAEVTALQTNLMAANYYKGPITGYYGKLTEAAVRRFQAISDLDADGIAGSETLAALKQYLESKTKKSKKSPKTPQTSAMTVGKRGLRLGDRGPEVTEAQERLKAAGFDPGSIDGKYGRKTEQAVKRFQVARGLKIDGIMGRETWFAAGYLATSNSPYSVIVMAETTETLRQVRQYVPNAYQDSSSDSNIQAGAFANEYGAERQSQMLRSQGLNARVVYRR
ncbi:peptidoglycan-binding protein [Coleofasciculus sp. FACHB-1120]|uniref:peptidoglycan-binding domain-containing protein n=1 Tax=Coleofasciculus sp. FACHB-1120 TaxID=2692783 RepID=UPI001681E69D|nr:peptidoglycan-binding protein [Coleofasciculus sp. FACHB-1120]MBD2741714.1 peptidoglycan-binding protein [Coleofasciculus sp. FACHB-1120]